LIAVCAIHVLSDGRSFSLMYPVSLPDALPIYVRVTIKPSEEGALLISLYNELTGASLPNGLSNNAKALTAVKLVAKELGQSNGRSEEHTSELQSRENLVCRLLLENKNGN